jgi:hypothetical protein
MRQYTGKFFFISRSLSFISMLIARDVSCSLSLSLSLSLSPSPFRSFWNKIPVRFYLRTLRCL